MNAQGKSFTIEIAHSNQTEQNFTGIVQKLFSLGYGPIACTTIGTSPKIYIYQEGNRDRAESSSPVLAYLVITETVKRIYPVILAGPKEVNK